MIVNSIEVVKLIEDYRKITSILIPYTILCSFLSLYSYWLPFEVQPFEYISLGETLSHSVPFLMFASSMILPVVLLEYVRPSRHLRDPDHEDNQLYIKILVCIPLLTNAAILVIALGGSNASPILLAGLICGTIPGSISLSKTRPFIDNFSSQTSRMFICVVLCCLPGASMVNAVIKRADVVSVDKSMYVLGSDLTDGLEFADQKLLYLGRLAGYVFLLRQGEEHTVQYRMEDLKRLELRSSTKKKT